MRKSLFKSLFNWFANRRAFHQTRSFQAKRAVSVAVQLTLSGGLRRMA